MLPTHQQKPINIPIKIGNLLIHITQLHFKKNPTYSISRYIIKQSRVCYNTVCVVTNPTLLFCPSLYNSRSLEPTELRTGGDVEPGQEHRIHFIPKFPWEQNVGVARVLSGETAGYR